MRRSAEQTRLRILDAAYGLFWRQGLLRVSMDEIAAGAGITKLALYQHFHSKDAWRAPVLTVDRGNYPTIDHPATSLGPRCVIAIHHRSSVRKAGAKAHSLGVHRLEMRARLLPPRCREWPRREQRL